VPLQSLRELLDLLIEIHGQQEFQHLVTRDAQRALLDAHGGAGALAQAVGAIYSQYRQCSRELAALRGAEADREGRSDLLRHEIGELRTEATTAADIEALFVERKRIADRGRLLEAARAAFAACYEGDGASAHDLLAKAQAALRGAGGADPALRPIGELLAEAAINVREAADALQRYLGSLEVDPARQEEIERRAAALEALGRKHHRRPAELPQRSEELEQELQALQNAAHGAAELERRQAALGAEYHAAAARLSEVRGKAAASFGGEITALMQSLGMPGGRFEVSVGRGDEEFGAHGSDAIEFLVSANPGQPPKSLARVASGGELSRIGLAIQVAAAAKTRAECLVFDEVDAGIGGATAEIVGRQLRALGERGQVLCVTHLAQVASQAHRQLRVAKQNDGKTTRTTIEGLSDAQRVDEIARMLGGVDVSDQARSHAREMLASAAPAAAPKHKRSRGGTG